MSGLAAVRPANHLTQRVCHTLDDAVTDVAWLHDGSGFVCGSALGSLFHFDAGGSLRRQWRGHDAGVTRISPQPNNSCRLATAGEDGRVRLWDLDATDAVETLLEQNDWVEHLAWTHRGDVLAAAARKTVSLWRGTESIGMWYDARRHILAMDWAPDGRRLATAGNKGLFLWRLGADGADKAEPTQLLSFPGAPLTVAWQPRGSALAVGTQDGFLQLWRASRAAGGAKQLTMRGYPSKVTCLAWHPSKLLIATAGGPDVVLWTLPHGNGGAKGRPLRHHRATITALAWSGNGELMASGDRDGRLCIWDANGEPVFSQRLDTEIAAMCWQPGNQRLAVGDRDGQVRLVHQADDAEPLPLAPNQSIEDIHR